MQISPVDSINFNARFLKSRDMEKVANYAIEHGMFKELNEARLNIDSSYLLTKIDLKLAETEDGYPAAIFTRLIPRKSVPFPKYVEDYRVSRPMVYTSNAQISPFRFGMDLIIQMGSNVPNNKVFKRVVIEGK